MMAVDERHTELLFSYGTLQLEAVQMATFGRQLAGIRDVLRGFELLSLKIENQTVVAISEWQGRHVASWPYSDEFNARKGVPS
jgi:hypothetical protein